MYTCSWYALFVHTPPETSCLKIIKLCSVGEEGMGRLLEVCNHCGVWWCVQGVEKYLKPLNGIRGELAAVCVVGEADSEHQQSSDILAGKSAVIILLPLTHFVSLLPSLCPIITEQTRQSMLLMKGRYAFLSLHFKKCVCLYGLHLWPFLLGHSGGPNHPV